MIDALTDNSEILYRHAKPSDIDEGVPQSYLFAPLPKDRDMLSVDRSSITTARESYNVFTGNGYKCERIYGLSVGELKNEQILCYPDPLPPTPTMQLGNPAHALADYSVHSRAQQKIIAKRLKRLTMERGCVFVASGTAKK